MDFFDFRGAVVAPDFLNDDLIFEDFARLRLLGQDSVTTPGPTSNPLEDSPRHSPLNGVTLDHPKTAWFPPPPADRLPPSSRANSSQNVQYEQHSHPLYASALTCTCLSVIFVPPCLSPPPIPRSMTTLYQRLARRSQRPQACVFVWLVTPHVRSCPHVFLFFSLS